MNFCSDELPEIFFIVGRGRSGTTLIASYLDGTPNLSVAPECLFIMNLASRYSGIRFYKQDIRRFCNDLYLESRIRNWSFTREQVEEFILKHAEDGCGYVDIVRHVYLCHAICSGKKSVIFIGDKNPHYSLFVSELSSIFPSAWFLHITRDPRANVSSYRKVSFDSSNIGQLAGRWHLYNQAILDCKKQLGSRYMQLRFEDFVTDTKDALLRVNDFLGTSLDPDQTKPPKKSENQENMPWHSRLGSPMDPAVLSEWKETLSEKEIRLIECICARTAHHLGYDISERRKNWIASISLVRARISVQLEYLVFLLPMGIRSGLIRAYRRLTGTLK